MATEFGKAVRIKRIQMGCLLKDMADFLKVTSSYLSAIENGKRTLSDEIFDGICKYLDLTEEEVRELRGAADRSMKDVKIDLDQIDSSARPLFVQFARNPDKFDTDLLQNFLEKHGVRP